LVERGPEKAGVGGSIPSLATNNFNNLQIAKNKQFSSREQYSYIGYAAFAVVSTAMTDRKYRNKILNRNRILIDS
jgi:hypothetical protein